MTPRPTLVCVHAHPDDEAFFGGGASAHYARLGYGVVLITCTNGRLGFDGAGRAGNEPGHDGLRDARRRGPANYNSPRPRSVSLGSSRWDSTTRA